MGLLRAVLICAVLGLTSGRDGELVKIPGETALFNTSWDTTPYTYLSWSMYIPSDISNITIITSTGLGTNFSNPEYEDRITLFNNGSLELRNLTLEDRAFYTVNMTATEGPQISMRFLLYVYVPVSDVRVSASATDLIENSSVNFTCLASGSDLRFTWYKGSYVLSSQTPELTVTSVSRDDTRPFRCRVHNRFSSATSEGITLTISYGPDLTLKTVPSRNFYYEGDRVTLRCIVFSKPKAEITWFYNGDLLPFNGTELKLEELTLKHEGNYSCEAFNNKTMLNDTSPPAVIIVKENFDYDDHLSPWTIAAICIATIGVALSLIRLGIVLKQRACCDAYRHGSHASGSSNQHPGRYT